MNSDVHPWFDGFAGVVVGTLGLLVSLFGLTLVGASVLGGLWVAAIGGALCCAVLVASTTGRRLLRLPAGSGTAAAAGFVTVSLTLAVAFVLVNWATFS
ncbi:hypothetical protein [Halomarina ordinaria]|uniref:Uncharacterized protein n=1 Tax=Halomarina ordinaria TaxID=3033939 RepID=A0ABD5U5J2_9EURY|nr:hypothetical protein [Halomarina sp. PSRA2]